MNKRNLIDSCKDHIKKLKFSYPPEKLPHFDADDDFSVHSSVSIT
jgi:hypothetical protein